MNWASGSEAAGYSSPALVTIGDSQQIAVFNGKALLGLDPKTGEELWRYDFATDFDCNIATPLQIGKQLFISAGENHGSVMLDVKPDGEGFSVTEAWTSLGVQSTLRSAWQTGIVTGNHMINFDNVGAAGPIMHLTCINLDDGKRVWQKTRYGKGNLTSADGKLFITTMKGELVVAKVSTDSYQEIGRMQVSGMTRQAPALANGLLYIRDDREVICIDVRKN